jgi:hypothetical protein
MSFYQNFTNDILEINENNFLDKSLELFDYQYHTNDTYRSYFIHLKINKDEIRQLEDIPFLPIEFFKTHQIKSENWSPQKTFLSSGTTQNTRSKNLVRDVEFYHQISKSIFEHFFGPLNQYRILALLPSYQEQGHSSLVEMVDHFMSHSQIGSGFLSSDDSSLPSIFNDSVEKILIGVSYALLDLALLDIPNKHLKIMETGGMKGRKKEITRAHLHQELCQGFNINHINTEYGMTELTSQAYAKTDGLLRFPPWAKCLFRDINDPFTYLNTKSNGGINIIDLANVSTCAFIETKDLGIAMDNNYFNVIGRFDNSDIRGCNQL